MINWREIPFFRLLVPLCAGILLAIFFNYHPRPILYVLASVPLLFLAAAKIRGLYRYRWVHGGLLNIGLVLLGYVLSWYRLETNWTSHFSHFDFSDERMVIGRIADAPIKKGEWVKLELAAEAMGNAADSLRPVSGNILVYVAKDSAAASLRYGDELFFKSKITKVEAPKNPDAFDYGRYLHFQNIHHQAFVRESDWLLHHKRRSFSLYGSAIGLQEKFVGTLRRHLPTENEFTVGSALILGFRDEVPEDLLTAYSETGAMHVLAVSGLHVGVVFVILNFLFGRVKIYSPLWTVAKMLLILAGIWAFALVTGATPSVLRAAVMFSFVNVGMAMKRNNNIYNTLASSAFLLLIINPFWIASVSFQLSYLAVLGIVFFQSKIAKLWVVENKWLDKIWQLIAVSIAAQIMTLPLTLFYFNQFPTWFWLSSLVLVPLSGFELGAGLLLFLVDAIWETGAIWIGKALWAMLWLGNETVYFIQKLPLAIINGIWIGSLIAVLLYLVLASTMLAIGSQKFKWVLSALGLLLVVSISTAFTSWRWHSNRQIVVYNVYKHTAIDFFDGKKTCSLLSADIEKKALKFAVEGHRLVMGAGEIETVEISDTAVFYSDRCFYENGLVQFFDKKIAIVDHLLEPVAEKIKVDYLLLRNSPKVEMADLMEIFDCQLIIFDASNKRWRLEKWKEACEELGVEFYDINEKGAWVLDLKGIEQ